MARCRIKEIMCVLSNKTVYVDKHAYASTCAFIYIRLHTRLRECMYGSNDSLSVSKCGVGRQNVDFYVVCSKGTYIRSLAYDLARELGSCAHLVALRREMIGK